MRYRSEQKRNLPACLASPLLVSTKFFEDVSPINGLSFLFGTGSFLVSMNVVFVVIYFLLG